MTGDRRLTASTINRSSFLSSETELKIDLSEEALDRLVGSQLLGEPGRIIRAAINIL
jgi:hypothetical protein